MNHQIATFALALAVLGGVTVYEGNRWGRWGQVDTAEIEEFAARMKAIPENFGDWTSVPVQQDDSQMARAGLVAYVSREFENQKTGAKVRVLVACGRVHDVVIHTPDQCYVAAGFKAEHESHTNGVHYGERKGEFRGALFTREEGGSQEREDILWSFSHDGEWKAPISARMEFANATALYKVYVMMPPGQASGGMAANEHFLKDFLPELDKVLFSKQKSAEEAEAEA